MAQINGFLRGDKATYGEKIVLDHLEKNLPKEYAVYIECPLQDKRQLRYPDFIVLTNYGVIVLEVKDWVQIEQVSKFKVKIRTRNNEIREEGNPVNTAREYAILLHNEFKRVANGQSLDVPWGFAVVLPNLPNSVISQLRGVWGQEFVLNKSDLQKEIVNTRLKSTLPAQAMRALTRSELDIIRAAINPVVLIEHPDKTIILDTRQERIVSEPIKETPVQKAPAQPAPEPKPRLTFVDSLKNIFKEPPKETSLKASEELPSPELAISENFSIRLIRGIAGSGKSLVLAQRARYLTAYYPEWNILVLTFNKELHADLESRLKGTSGVKVRHFHELCSKLLHGHRPWKPVSSNGWLEAYKAQFPILQELGSDYLSAEIEWLKDRRILNLESYLEADRKGRSRQLGSNQRTQIFEIVQQYQAYLEQEGFFDWADVPHVVIDGIQTGIIQPERYDAILIDEAQDFAPGWIQVTKNLLNPEGGVFFLADDPTQSIYRYYSWKEKGVPVVGRTRWLKVPYRNTFEIYQAAYQIIASDDNLRKALDEEGVLVVPDLQNTRMRHGPKPLLQKWTRLEDEVSFIKEKVQYLLQTGMDARQIAVLHRRKTPPRQLAEALKGTDVLLNTYHAYKGMEFEVVFLCQIQETELRQVSDEEEHKERRLIYMTMTRAREQLYMGYEGRLPARFKALEGFVDHVS